MPIRKLSTLVANQIAAGEVVERPASVVKELLENSIDAGCKRIQVDIERGGTRLIRITDDGCGINKQQLELALARHATSKIEHSEDLNAIHSLGFRGEALASISSVSRLTLSSKPEQQELGWSAAAEGLDMSVKIHPQSLPVGTIVEVKDLFFNTPARQKFLRSERTEYVHIEEIIKRIALANPNVAITLKHNGKVTKRIAAANSFEQQKQRIGAIVSHQFLSKALYIDSEIETLRLSGWISPIDLHQSSSLDQYVFVNGRVVKDRMLNHAIRQSYQDLLPTGRMPSYVLYLTINPEKIDVNVHPTKHEVRFSDSRMVHDFIERVIKDSLSKQENLTELGFNSNLPRQLSDLSDDDNTEDVNYIQSHQGDKVPAYDVLSINEERGDSFPSYRSQRQSSPQHYSPSKKGYKSNVLFAGKLYILEIDNRINILDIPSFCLDLMKTYLSDQWSDGAIKQKPILIPHRIGFPNEDSKSDFLDVLLKSFSMLGFDLTQSGPQSLLVRKVPSCVENLNIQEWLQKVVYQLVTLGQSKNEEVRKMILNSMDSFWDPKANINWTEFLDRHDWKQSQFCHTLSAEKFVTSLIGQKHE